MNYNEYNDNNHAYNASVRWPVKCWLLLLLLLLTGARLHSALSQFSLVSAWLGSRRGRMSEERAHRVAVCAARGSAHMALRGSRHGRGSGRGSGCVARHGSWPGNYLQ
jgi:hypothetical protein